MIVMTEKRLDPYLDIRNVDMVPIIGIGTFLARDVMSIFSKDDVQYVGLYPLFSKEGSMQIARIFAFYAVHSGALSLLTMAAENYLHR